MKKTFAIILMLLFTVSASICGADEDMLDQAYSYYNRGMMNEAIEVMHEAAGDNPTSGQLYFIGYAYYKLQDFRNARKYFDMAYEVNADFNPMADEQLR